jgi:UDP-N-acetylglucosamine 4,6-dehydratase (inverting)
MLNGKTILITGGTGSFGKRFVQRILANYKPKKLIIYSRDELKQFEMAKVFSAEKHSCIRYFLGDVRDRDRLLQAFRGVDIVIHAAALKHVPAAEYNPFEYIKTNVMGAQNIIEAAIERGVTKVVALSTDKASNPINLYGATKLCSDKLFVAGNSYSGAEGCRFAVVRYGNVIGSRGSVIPFFQSCRTTGVLPVTDDRMTRFLITLDQGVDLVFKALETTAGGEIYVPKIPSMKITDIASAIAPECDIKFTGIRPGEKLHESMISVDDAAYTFEYEDHYRIYPAIHNWYRDTQRTNGGKLVAENFEYTSDKNTSWLNKEQLCKLLDRYLHAGPELIHKDDQRVSVDDVMREGFTELS